MLLEKRKWHQLILILVLTPLLLFSAKYVRESQSFRKPLLMKLKIQKNKRKLKFLANDKLEEMAEAKKNNNIEESDYEKLLTKYGSRDLVVINAGITHILKKTIQFSDQVIFFKSI